MKLALFYGLLMKLSFFYGLLIVSQVRGNVDIDVLQQVGDSGCGGGQSAEGDVGTGGGQSAEGDVGTGEDEGAGEETSTTSPPPVWCDPGQGWQQTPNGICYLIVRQMMSINAISPHCQGLGHDIIEWNGATNNEIKLAILNEDSLQNGDRLLAGARLQGSSFFDRDLNFADISGLGSITSGSPCTQFRKGISQVYLEFVSCTGQALPLCQWNQENN